MSDRAVSNTIGVILIFGITIASVTALVVVGGAVIDDTRADAERSQMENSMSGFSSKASLVGLGESGDQRFSLGRSSEGQVDIREDAGRVHVYIEWPEGGTETIAETSMGSVVYRNGDREVAYQGGGVWERQGDFSRMLSPPEYHYRGETLTFPIINVGGSGSATGDVRGTIRTDTESRQLYPNTEKDFDNPLTDGTVYVRVESEYCRGWYSFFEARSQGTVESECDGEGVGAVVVDLTVSFDPVFGTAVTADRIEPGGAHIESSREGIVAPSASTRVEERIDECDPDGCNDWSASPDGGTYYTTTGEDLSGLTVNTNNGDVDLVVNDLTGGVDISDDITVSGSGNVTVYLRTDGDISVSGGTSINEEDGNPEQFLMYVHSDVSGIKLSGNPTYVGGIYAPNTSLEGDQGSGGGCGAGANLELTGSVVVDNFCFNNGNFNHDPVMDDVEIEVDADTIKYLHISENHVDVELN